MKRTVLLCRWKQASLWCCFLSFFLLLLLLLCFGCAFTAAWWSLWPWFWSAWPWALVIWKGAHLATTHCQHWCWCMPACTWSYGFPWIWQRVHLGDGDGKPTFSLWDEGATYLVLAESVRKANSELACWSQAWVSIHLRSTVWLQRGWTWCNRQAPIPLGARFNLLWRQRAKARLQWERTAGRAGRSELNIFCRSYCLGCKRHKFQSGVEQPVKCFLFFPLLSKR